jgi:hypothetical protein
MPAYTRWRKSSFSQGSGSSCVEVALAEDRAGLRDSKNTGGPILTVPALAWRGFIALWSAGRREVVGEQQPEVDRVGHGLRAGVVGV